MKALLERLAAGAGDVSVTYHIGNSFSGETQLELHGDGAWALSSNVTEGRARLERSGTLPAERVQALARVLLDARVWEARPQGEKRKQDDPLATITVAGADDTQTVGVPASQTHAVAPFASAQTALLELAHDLSDGTVLEQGR